ncbi:unnamed protein product [Rotaria sp. Silwood2]|nr:unnamed protein product [Rotaria sp. Silwood2]CAF2557754.1 unnamed protein product [Rotaria sp. Silwood2]CAF2819745.1 unnamed protein product [Rotaria sp. Silwood2]CAF2972441.1 unnamed protein product [Rotaria sp. Silwood2]CAF3889650.1 unnamed protein product [Rotaria sp. Silwood2]
MASHRFEVTVVPEPNRNVSSIERSEIIPLIHIENEIPTPPPLPAALPSVYEKNKNRTSSRFFNTILLRKSLDIRRRATIAAAVGSISDQLKKSSSVDAIHKTESKSTPPSATSQIDLIIAPEVEESDTYSTVQSNNYDTNPLRITNKFLQELRAKRRELHEKSKNIAIDQRIDLNRRRKQRTIVRAQDIFDVHFQLNNDDDDELPLLEPNIFTEESQEKIRNDIYNELNRQRVKQYDKQKRHLILGQSLLLFMTSLLAFMSLTLIYVVFDLYNRANHSDAKIPENKFISMINDKATNFY